jgi:hypothetical protein
MRHRRRECGTLGGLARGHGAGVTIPSFGPRPSTGPTVVILTDFWESSSEPGWITRQVAGALACEADVHVVTSDGLGLGTTTDSVFTVHRVDPDAPARDGDDPVNLLHADYLVVTARTWSGLDNLADLTALSRKFDIDADLPVTLLAPAADWDVNVPGAANRLLERSRAVLTVTDAGRSAAAGLHIPTERSHAIGAPLAANPSALSEPDPLVGEAEYVVVYTGVREHDPHPATELGQLLRMRFPDRVVALLHTDAFCVWQGGRPKRTEAVERSSDMARLMAWARVTVDLRPGCLFARRCVESLLYGTPIVVPFDTRAREHAERGRAGLWFANPAELSWCVEAMLDPPNRAAFSSQGRAYAEAEFGSTDRFIERVLTACGLATSTMDTLTG